MSENKILAMTRVHGDIRHLEMQTMCKSLSGLIHETRVWNLADHKNELKRNDINKNALLLAKQCVRLIRLCWQIEPDHFTIFKCMNRSFLIKQ